MTGYSPQRFIISVQPTPYSCLNPIIITQWILWRPSCLTLNAHFQSPCLILQKSAVLIFYSLIPLGSWNNWRRHMLSQNTQQLACNKKISRLRWILFFTLSISHQLLRVLLVLLGASLTQLHVTQSLVPQGYFNCLAMHMEFPCFRTIQALQIVQCSPE